MSQLPPGPPTPPTSGPTGPPPPRVAPPYEEPSPTPGRGGLPKLFVAGAVVFVLCFGLGLGFVLAGGDDDPDAASSAGATDEDGDDGRGDAPSTPFLPGGPGGGEGDPPADTLPIPDDPFGDLPDELPDDLDGLDELLDQLPEGFEDLLPDDLLDELDDLEDLEDLPDRLGDVQVTIAFTDDAAPRRMERIRDAFEDSDLLSFVQYVTAEQLEDLAGGPLPLAIDTLSAFSRQDVQAASVRDFVCDFADDPAVRTVQLFGAEPCDQSL